MIRLIIFLWCVLLFNASLYGQKRYNEKLKGIKINYSLADTIEAIEGFAHGRCEDYHFNSPAQAIYATTNPKIKYVKILSGNEDKVLAEGFRIKTTKIILTPIFRNKPCFIPTLIKLMPRRIKADVEIGDWIFYDSNGTVVYEGEYKEYIKNTSPNHKK
jgi:hypothetical protein